MCPRNSMNKTSRRFTMMEVREYMPRRFFLPCFILAAMAFLATPVSSFSTPKERDQNSPAAPIDSLQAMASKTMSLLAGMGEYSLRIVRDLGQPFWRAATGWTTETKGSGQQQAHVHAATPVGYSPNESMLRCKECGQETVIRGSLPGMVIICPACGKAITS